MEKRGVRVATIGTASHPLITVAEETIAGLRKREPSQLLHYVADTGPLVPTRLPSVVTVHGVASRWISTARTARQERIWRARVSRAIRSCDRIISVSRSSADDIAETFTIPRDEIVVIPHGVGTVVEEFDAEHADDHADDLDSTVLYLGNIEPRKNLIELVRAFESPSLSDVRLVIAGRPAWNHAATMAEIRRSPSTTHLGFVSESERQRLVRNCALFVFPSLYEGFGLPVLEALSMGAVVLSSDRGALDEVAGPAMRFTGLDAEAIAADIRRALDDRDARCRVREEGPIWAERYTWESSAEAHLRVYESLL
nr:glycosyltransferase family 1 protein [Gordonia soli]